RPRKKPKLIKNSGTSGAQVVGGMVYNPELQQWEGNEEALLEFDRVTSLSKLRPALITNMGRKLQIPHQMGGMVFDPVLMKWIGNEEEDVFADFADDFRDSSREDSTTFSELTLSKALKQSLYISESSHKLFLGKWYPKALIDSKMIIRDTSKVHLHEIRRMRVR
ncbi:hypothetical protein HK101_007472, partial [Irineochytrium annulatum]